MKPVSDSYRIILSLSGADQFRSRISEFALANGVSEITASKAELAVYELLVNAVEHIPEGHRGEEASVESFVDSEKLTVKVSFRGDSFDLTRVNLPDINVHAASGKKRGLGIYMIRKLADNVSYSRSGNRNTVEIQLLLKA